MAISDLTHDHRNLDEPVVSVVLCTFNRLELMKRSLRCISAQTYRSLQLVVCNDGSTDGTFEFLEHIQFERPLKVINNRENLGLAGIRNLGMEATDGELIAFYDDDDVWFPEKLETQVRFYLENADENTLCFSRFERDDGKSVSIAPGPLDVSPSVGDYIFVRDGILLNSTMLASRNVVRRVEIPKGIKHEDWIWFLRLEAAGASFVVCPEPLVNWNVEIDRSRLSLLVDPDSEMNTLEHASPYLTSEARANYVIKYIVPQWFVRRDWRCVLSAIREHAGDVSFKTLLAAGLKCLWPYLYFRLRQAKGRPVRG